MPTSDVDDLARAFQDAARTAIAVVPELGGGFRGMAENRAQAARIVRHFRDIVALSPRSLRDATALDAGCGFGASALVLVLLGARQVHAADLGEAEIAALERYLPELGALGAKVHPRRASVSELPYADGSIDFVLSNETYGVIYHLEQFLDEIVRVLAPGGAVVLAEKNDVLNPLLARHAQALWAAYELGPAGAEVHGHRIETPYVERREQIVRRVLPNADARDVRSIAEGTSGMVDKEIVAACAVFQETGTLADIRFDPREPPIDPAGLRVEAPVDPRWLRTELERRGLRGRVVGYWGGANGRRSIRVLNRMLQAAGALLLRTAPSVRVVAVKPA